MRGLATEPTDRFESAESFGVALAEHAAGCWGADWLSRAGIAVIGADTIVAAATATNHRASVRDSRATQDTTSVTGGARSAPTTRVRQAQPLPKTAVDLADLGRDDVAPVQQIVKFPSRRRPYAVAAVLALAAIAVAALGIGAQAPPSDLKPGVLTVAGADPATTGAIEVDMTKPIPVTVAGAQGDAAALALRVLDTPLGRHEATLVAGENGLTATLSPPVNPYLLAGRNTAELTILSTGNVVATHHFAIQSTQSAFNTALTVGTVIVCLFALAYAESYLRALRRGRSRLAASLGLPASAAALAIATVAAAWVVLGHQPTMTTVIVCVTMAVAAGVSSVIGGIRSGRVSRCRRDRRARQRPLTSAGRQ